MALAVQVTIDAANPDALSRFWALALGYREEPPPQGFDSWQEWARSAGIPEERWNDYRAVVDPDGKGPRVFLQRVPEPKVAKNRMHLDVRAAADATDPEDRKRRLRAHAETLVGAGATVVKEFDEIDQFWIVMQDPEGNEFCLD